ncbi:hypothetical protein Mro02_56260 [Microbispora rosea subsp. aerata]|nr:hypothetical protein Mro02_56260 [Microbispora rosea subsp. aerata]GLJ82425.1 hypothetical protein GCM10017588_11500 [Microbispora rosea subsp. aerata]
MRAARGGAEYKYGHAEGWGYGWEEGRRTPEMPEPGSPPTARLRIKAVPPGIPSPKAPAGPRFPDAVPPSASFIKKVCVVSPPRTCFNTTRGLVMKAS